MSLWHRQCPIKLELLGPSVTWSAPLRVKESQGGTLGAKEGHQEPRRGITTGAAVGDCTGMLQGCHISKMVWPRACHWIFTRAGLCPLTPDTCHQSPSAGELETAPSVRLSTTWPFSIPTTSPHAGAAPKGALCTRGWQELLSKPSQLTCKSRLSSADHPKQTYKWMFDTFPFDISEINVWIFHFKRTFNLKNNNNSQKRRMLGFFLFPTWNNCSYGLIFLIDFGATRRTNVSFRLAWNTVVQISQWFKKKKEEQMHPAPVCTALLRSPFQCVTCCHQSYFSSKVCHSFSN